MKRACTALSGALVRSALALGALHSGVAAAAYQWNFQTPGTKVAQEVSDLHLLMMAIIAVIFVGVFGVMFYSIYAHRKSVGHKASQFHENTTVEVLWTVIPLIILVLMAWPATRVLFAVRDTAQADITVKATGYQWKWGYDYIKGEGEGISLIANLATSQDQIYGKAPKDEHYLLETDNHLVVPVGKKIRILTTAADVIHSWFVPALAVKQDAIPGFIRDTAFRADKEGLYRGQCAELCGKDHGFMPIVVEVVSQEKYAAWVTEQKKKIATAAEDPGKRWDLADLRARGEKVYATNCVACHQANGKGVPNAFPALDGSKVVNGPAAGQIAVVLNGRPGTAMQAFGKQLSDTDLAAVITYTRSAWTNKASENLVQPGEVKAARK
jgi:cytochrome c oxidase subunit 2